MNMHQLLRPAGCDRRAAALARRLCLRPPAPKRRGPQAPAADRAPPPNGTVEYPGANDVTNIDKQRVSAVRKLEALGYRYQDGEWVLPASA